jgi:hypothetical protein
MQRYKQGRQKESRLEMEKLLKDKECLHCEKFFDCKGKPKDVKECLNFKERKDLKGSD